MREIDLFGEWELKKAGTAKVWKARVPGCVHTDLLAVGEIPDPYHRDNETRLQWIGHAVWTYVREFEVDADFPRHDRVILRCEMLDTLATVKVNGCLAGKADNMFRVWEFDVRKLLKAGRNRIEVRFLSPFPYIKERQRVLNRKRGFQLSGVGSGSGWMRKEPCNFGWDWGPVLVTCGIQRSIKLVGFNTARLKDVHVVQRHGSGGVTIEASVEAECAGRPVLRAGVGLWRKHQLQGQVLLQLRNGRGRVRIEVPRPELWWPVGMGGQPLYELTVDLFDESGELLDTETKRIGLRTLRLERKKDRWGESFRFVANGVRFFAKGADWIPADTFQSRVSVADRRRLIEDARAANMNMLRVWGGGVYEEDGFYDICDELGICVWQDFMFACNTYPAFDRKFMASVREEVADNVRRLRHHPSIALWCGNNEMEQLNVDKQWRKGRMSWSDYKKLFDVLIPSEVRRHDPERDYWPSSPHTPRGGRGDSNHIGSGDAHLWGVWHGMQPFESYRKQYHRLVSEFGFQSYPEPKTTRGFTISEDRNVTSRIMEHHQRSGIGNAVIMHYMLSWFRLPVGFENTVWLSQILQGLAIKYGVEHWRRNMPRCMGAIYWQLNDCWPVVSWASIDYRGRWKALHYEAKRFFAPLMVSGVERPQSGEVEVHVTSDLMTVCRAMVRWTVTDVLGKRFGKGTKSITARAGASSRVAVLKLKKLVDRLGATNILVWLDLVADHTVVSSNLVLFARPKHLDFQEPEITAQAESGRAGAYAVTLKARRPALWTWLELKGSDARFSDNFVHLRPGAPVRVIVSPARKMNMDDFVRRLSVKSLIDTF